MNLVKGKLKKTLVISIIVVGLLFAGAAAYLVMSTMNLGKKTVDTSQTDQAKTTKAAPTPEAVKTDLETTNNTTTESLDNHKATGDAINETQTPLIN